ncbi:MAG: hypothetical protein ABSG95_12215 [Solirubrobacteraceae bacterium]|jgi:hypothetical protein
MTNRAHRTFAIALALTLAGSAEALAAGPLNGKTYEGGAPSSGVNSEGHRQRTHATGNIIIRVAANGRSVSVRFSSSSPVLYCSTQQHLHVQSTKPASISRGGTFRATIDERFAAGPGAPAIVQVVTGQFSGRSVRGTIHTQAAECGGVASFAATAR